jgi:2-phospho-L-lactate/phosphoenolpyruvate guanylyltransferase
VVTISGHWPDAGGRVWAAVPFKGPIGSKRRLAGLLDESERKRLSLTMFEIVMSAVLNLDDIDTILVVTPSRDFVTMSQTSRLLTVYECPPPADDGAASDGLNFAVQTAQRLAFERGAEKLLIVPADLPLLASSDLSAMLDAGTHASVAIAPDRERRGTNALLLAPPTAIEPGFGDGSYLSHHRRARAAYLSVKSVERAGLMIDLDTPADVDLMLEIGGDGRVVRMLREFGAAERLERSGPR